MVNSKSRTPDYKYVLSQLNLSIWEDGVSHLDLGDIREY